MENVIRTQTYGMDGNLFEERYRIPPKFCFHREDGPAFISYYPGNILNDALYYNNGKRHRIDGPACTKYFMSGNIIEEQYWVNDQRIDSWLDEMGIELPPSIEDQLLIKLAWG